MKSTSCQNYSATDKSDKSSKMKMKPLPDLNPCLSDLSATPQGLSKAWWPKTNWNRSNDSPLPETTQRILRSKDKSKVILKILDLNALLRSSCLVEFLWVGEMDGFN